ncbi:MAG: glycosyltransferase family 2 protein [Leptolyngbyaceae cyanobacterium]
MSTVSIVIPVYNGAKTIARTLESILKQTYQDLEIIVINDGSKDNTLEVVAGFEDPRIKVCSYPNGGLPVARNRGIDNATGEFISFVDADDLWSQDKIECQVNALNRDEKAGVAYSWTAFIDEYDNFLYACVPLHHAGDVYPALLVRNFIANGSNILVRRSIVEEVGQFDPNLHSVEDWEYYLRLAARCNFSVVKKHQIYYRKSSQAMSASVPRMESYGLTVIERAFSQAPKDLQYLKPRSLSKLYRYLALQCVRNSSSREDLAVATQKLTKSILNSPRSLLERDTQRLTVKLFILNTLPQDWAKSLIERLGDKPPVVLQ